MVSSSNSSPKKTVRVGLRFPKWATQNDLVINGMVNFLRNEQLEWLIDADIDTQNELPPNNIDAEWKGDGLIVFRCTEREAVAWKKAGIKVVNISSETQIEGVPNILPDNFQMGQLAAEYLLSLGFTNFAFVGEEARIYSQLRQQGFEETLKLHGHSCHTIDLKISQLLQTEKWTHLHDSLNAALRDLPLPLGILARDDIVAMNVLRSIRALGINIPEDIALIGINNSSPYCHLANPKLTSIKHPGALIGFHAARVLQSMMNGAAPENDLLLKSSGIVERESTNTVAVKDKLVAQAIRIIKDKAPQEVVTVSSLCAELGVSATKFRLRFIEATGYTPKELIDKTRHKKVQQLLAETDLSIQSIAYQLEFNSSEDLSRFFARHEGMPPTKYRTSLK